MRTVPLGNTGARVSAFCLGTMHFGSRTNEKTSFGILDKYFEAGATASQVIYAWMTQSDPPVIPLVGASTIEQLEENLGALEVRLSPEQMKHLDDASG